MAPRLAVLPPCAALVLGGWLLSQGAVEPVSRALPTSERYHPDAAHPWNRLHAALARRRTPGGRVLGLDEPDLLLWNVSDHLLEPARQAELLAALEAFVSADDEAWIDAPLARVLMQHDLWAAFDWAVAGVSSLGPLPRVDVGGGLAERIQERLADPREELESRRAELARALARALARVAPSAEALASLPDNLAAALASWDGARAPDPAQPQRPFLPDGEWVLVDDAFGGPEPLASQHAEVFGGRSLFEVRLAVPGGREATLAWLARLREHPTPSVACDGSTCGGFDERAGEHHLHLSPDLPAPPAGTLVALVRRVLAFDDAGHLRATPLVKSVQLRAFLEAPGGAADLQPWDRPPGWPWQAVTEFVLEPARLLDGEADTLRPIRAGEHAFRFLGAHGDGVAHLADDFDAPGRGGHLDSCASCHGAAGTLAFNSYTGVATGPGTQLDIPLRRPPRPLAEADPWTVGVRATSFKRRRFDWGVLWGWLADEPAPR